MSIAKQDREIFRRANHYFDKMGVLDRDIAQKADGAFTTADRVGQFMDRKIVNPMIEQTKRLGGFTAYFDWKVVEGNKGQIPLQEFTGPMIEFPRKTDGHPGVNEPQKGLYTTLDYSCEEAHIFAFQSFKAMREAGVSGQKDFERTFRKGFAKQMGNNLAQIIMQGNRDLDDTTKLNRMLRGVDGVLKQAAAQANSYYPTTPDPNVGKAFDPKVFAAMRAKLPPEYKDDADLAWIHAPMVDDALAEALENFSPTQTGGSRGSRLGDLVTIERGRIRPKGIDQLLCAYVPTDGAGALSAVAPTSVVDSTTYATVRVHSLLDDGTSYAGRKVKVTYTPTGQSEICEVYVTGGNNTCKTEGMLGQQTISTTASEYSIQLADITQLLLTNPANIAVIVCGRIQAFRKWEQEHRRWRIDMWLEMDVKIKQPRAMIHQDGVILSDIGGWD